MNKYNDAMKIMTERFSKDSLIGLATTDGKCLHNRMVDAFYEDGTFYAVTYTLSNKMKNEYWKLFRRRNHCHAMPGKLR